MLLHLRKHQKLVFEKFILHHISIRIKYKLLINVREKVGIKELKNPKAFIDYSQLIDDV